MQNVLFGSILKNPESCTYDGEDNDEKILYIFRQSFITNLDWMFVAAVLLITPVVANSILVLSKSPIDQLLSPFFTFVLNVFWYLFTIGFILENFLLWFYNVYIITNKKIVDIDFVGLLYKNISEASILSIEDVTSKVSGATRVIFNYGSVYVQTAGEQREFEFIDVPNSAKVRDIISDIAIAEKQRDRKRHGGNHGAK